MKKNLAKRIVLGLLTGAVLMSSSVVWAEGDKGYNIDLTGFSQEYYATDSLSIGGSVFKPANDTGCERSIAIGIESQVGSDGIYNQKATDSVAVGYKAYVTSAGSIALGSEAQVDGINSMALGYQAEVRNGYQNSVALGKGSVASESNVVSVGVADDPATDENEGVYRKIVNVEDGEIDTGSHDAVTGGQLYDNYGGGAATLKTNGSTLIEGKGYDLTTALIKLSEEVEDNIYTKDQVNNLLSNGGVGGNSGNYVKTEDVVSGGKETAIGSLSVQESTSGSVTLGTSSSAVVTFEQDKVVFGKNSSWYQEAEGFFAGGNANHDVSSAKAALKEDGSLMGASGKFIVDSDGNLGIGDGTKATFAVKADNGNVTANGDVYVGGALVVGSNFAVDSASGNVKANALDAAVDVFANGKSLVATANQAEANKQAIEGKADKATTLAGYGISDAYTKTEVDSLIGGGTAAIAGLNQRLEKTNAKINKVGAGAAALAALHPLDYDPDDKLTFSAGMGNYAGENAAALGAFYRPNEKFMLSLGGTMGNGENMVNLGLSIGLDKASGFAKMSKRELIQEVNAVKAENEAMKDQLANADERIAKLEALVAQLVAK